MLNRNLETSLSIEKTNLRSEAENVQGSDAAAEQAKATPGRNPAIDPRSRRGAEPAKPKGKGLRIFAWFMTVALSFGAGVLFFRNYTNNKQVIVAVDGAEISQEDMFDSLEKGGGRNALRQLVTEQIQIDYAKERGVLPKDSVVKKAVAAALSDPAFQQEMTASGETYEDYYRDVQVNLAKAAVVTEGITVSDADIKAYYDANVRHDNPTSRFYTPETTTLQVIRNHSQEVIEMADHDIRNGRDFSSVVASYSTDQSKGNEGISQALVRGRNNMRQVPGMEDQVFSIGIGETLGPIKFAGDWWIFKCLDKTPATTIPYSRAYIEAEIGARMAKVTPQRIAAVQQDFERYQKGVNIQVFWKKYKDTLTLNN